jgi:hypothetical protein
VIERKWMKGRVDKLLSLFDGKRYVSTEEIDNAMGWGRRLSEELLKVARQEYTIWYVEGKGYEFHRDIPRND